MPEDPQHKNFRDGVSQFQRLLAALRPESAPIDERTAADWIRFAREYAKELKFFNLNNEEEPNGWSEFIQGDPDEIAAYLENPQAFQDQPEKRAQFTRPHFTLFLAFLKMLAPYRDRMNGLTKRHLDFYYRRYLGLESKIAQADQLHLLLQPAKNAREFLVAKGLQLLAGKDSQGKDRYYQTDSDFLINQAQIADLRSLHLQSFTSEEDDRIQIRQNLWSACDARAIQASRAFEEASARWHTFGKTPSGNWPTADIDFAPVGLVIASPILLLQEGERKVVLKFTLDKSIDDLVINNKTFFFCFSIAEGLRPLDFERVTPVIEEKLLTLTLDLYPEDPPIEAIAAGNRELDDIQTDFPILQMLLAYPATGEPNEVDYNILQQLSISNLKITTEVTGLKNLRLQNDRSELDPHKPFEPFGPVPKPGAAFSIFHPELAAKQLDTMDLHFTWQDLPSNGFSEYYGTYYEHEFLDEDSFAKPPPKTEFRIVDHRTIGLINHSFDPFTDNGKNDISDNFEIKNDSGHYEYKHLPAVKAADQVVESDRYFQLELKSSFLHDQYAFVLNQQVKLAAKPNPDPEKDIPKIDAEINPPYDPILKTFSIDYTSSTQFDFTTENGLDTLYYLHPFGYQDVRSENGPPRLAPPYPANLESPSGQIAGELYIGLEKLSLPQEISLLFQVAEGSANPEATPSRVYWSFLSGNKWVRFDEQNRIVVDTTNNLRRPGILRLAIPAEATTEHTRMPPGLHWIKSNIDQNPQSVGDLVDVHAQAIRVVFTDRDNAPDHYDQPLPSGSVKGFRSPLPGIRKVLQPYTSFGGRPAEKDAVYYTRISERLRHKQRALTSWDYERLVLERFPEVYKVKCLPAEKPGGEKASLADLQQRGRIRIVVIPNIRGKLPFDPFEPKVPFDTLQAIREYLRPFAPPWAWVFPDKESEAREGPRFEVVNAHFQRVRLRVVAQFRPGYNEGFYARELERALQRYLSPWAFDDAADIPIGGDLYASLLIDFIERQPYVDFIIRFYMKNVSIQDDTGATDVFGLTDAQSVLRANRPDAVWVSDPNHLIRVIPADQEEFRRDKLAGVGYMVVEFDFQIGEPETP